MSYQTMDKSYGYNNLKEYKNNISSDYAASGFVMFPIETECKSCKGNSFGTTNDGNRTQICSTCGTVALRDGKRQ
jgi:hypothetical protein